MTWLLWFFPRDWGQEAGNAAKPLFVCTLVQHDHPCSIASATLEASGNGLQGILKGNSPREKPMHPMLEARYFWSFGLLHNTAVIWKKLRDVLVRAGTNAFRNGSTSHATTTRCSWSPGCGKPHLLPILVSHFGDLFWSLCKAWFRWCSRHHLPTLAMAGHEDAVPGNGRTKGECALKNLYIVSICFFGTEKPHPSGHTFHCWEAMVFLGFFWLFAGRQRLPSKTRPPLGSPKHRMWVETLVGACSMRRTLRETQHRKNW